MPTTHSRCTRARHADRSRPTRRRSGFRPLAARTLTPYTLAAHGIAPARTTACNTRPAPDADHSQPTRPRSARRPLAARTSATRTSPKLRAGHTPELAAAQRYARPPHHDRDADLGPHTRRHASRSPRTPLTRQCPPCCHDSRRPTRTTRPPSDESTETTATIDGRDARGPRRRSMLRVFAGSPRRLALTCDSTAGPSSAIRVSALARSAGPSDR